MLGHRAENWHGAGRVVASGAVAQDNPEVAALAKRVCRLGPRAQMRAS